MKVEQLMKREVKVCGVADSLNRAAQLMWEADCGCVPVISSDGDGAVVGVITDRDIAIAAYTQGKPLGEIPVGVAMAKKVIACQTGDGLRHAEALMRENRVRRLPVLDQNHRVAGILSLNDIAREVRREKAGGRPQEVTADDLAETFAAVCEPRGGREMSVSP